MTKHSNDLHSMSIYATETTYPVRFVRMVLYLKHFSQLAELEVPGSPALSFPMLEPFFPQCFLRLGGFFYFPALSLVYCLTRASNSLSRIPYRYC